MRPSSTTLVTNLSELDAWIEREGIRFFKIGVFDPHPQKVYRFYGVSHF